MSGAILTLNSGSSSLKFAVFSATSPDAPPELRGSVSGIGRAPVFSARDAQGVALSPGAALAALGSEAGQQEIVARLLPWIDEALGPRDLVCAGHRVVHGGRNHAAPARVTSALMDALGALVPLAPLHQPHNLAAIRAVDAWRPALPQIACFDTAFHRTQDRLASLYPLPRHLIEDGILRYGFHGISYEYIAGILPDHLGPRAEGRVIVAHLGNGASMCAMRERASVATSMGFTALDGLMMGRRCGALDPGIVLHLIQARGMRAAEVEDMLYNQSGLYGVSQISNNMQVLLDSDDPNAREAVALFCHRAASVLGGLIPAIGGLDALIFTAGIGENSAPVRRAICDRLAWLGIDLDEAANGANARRVSSPRSAVDVLALPTNEEAVVADACRALMDAG